MVHRGIRFFAQRGGTAGHAGQTEDARRSPQHDPLTVDMDDHPDPRSGLAAARAAGRVGP